MHKKWEYRVVSSHEIQDKNWDGEHMIHEVSAYLNQLGQEGWEIINLDLTETERFYNFFGVAKRELKS